MENIKEEEIQVLERPICEKCGRASDYLTIVVGEDISMCHDCLIQSICG